MAFAISEMCARFEQVGMARRIRLFPTAAATYAVGDPIVITNKKAAVAAAAGANVVGLCTKAMTAPAVTGAFAWVEVDLFKPVPHLIANVETPYDDGTVAATALNVASFGATFTGANVAVDNSIRQAVLYVYDGPGRGEARLINDYDAAGGAQGAQQCTFDFLIDGLSTTSKCIVLGSGSDGEGIYPGGPVDCGGVLAYNIALNDIAGAYIVLGFEDLHRGILHFTPTDTVFNAP